MTIFLLVGPDERGDDEFREGGRGMRKRKKSPHNYRVEASAYMTQSFARLSRALTPERA